MSSNVIAAWANFTTVVVIIKDMGTTLFSIRNQMPTCRKGFKYLGTPSKYQMRCPAKPWPKKAANRDENANANLGPKDHGHHFVEDLIQGATLEPRCSGVLETSRFLSHVDSHAVDPRRLLQGSPTQQQTANTQTPWLFLGQTWGPKLIRTASNYNLHPFTTCARKSWNTNFT